MTGDKTKFISLTPRIGGHVTYGDNNKGKILGIGNVGNPSSTIIENVLYVEGLRHNLLSISQLCDKAYRIIFNSNCCIIENVCDKQINFIGHRVGNIYMISLENIPSNNTQCLLTKDEDAWLWHRRIAHIHMEHLNKLISKELVIGLPKIKFQKDKLCDACQKGKQVKASFKAKNIISTNRPLQLLHMDLFGPSRTMSLGGNYYALVIVDDFSRFTWTMFIPHKNKAFHVFIKLAKRIQNEKDLKIASIRSDHGGEFENHLFESYCEENRINHNFSAPRTPQQNGVVERKNRSLEELARTMINETNLPKYFWADAVNTACYVLNRVLIRPILKKTPYELYKGRKPNISHFRVFGCKCFILNNGKENLGKFDAKADEGIFVGYALSSKAFRVYNKRTMTIEESIHIAFDESNPQLVGKDVVIENVADLCPKPSEETNIEKKVEENEDGTPPNEEKSQHLDLPQEWRTSKDHPIDQVIGDISKGVTTRSNLRNICNYLAFVSQIEPKTISEAILDENWLMAMHDELNQFERNEV